jgi:putative ABC transport system substrate-binding protein
MAVGIGRRQFISALGCGTVAWPLAAQAQQATKIYHVGLLSGGPAIGVNDDRRKTLLSVLAARGFVEGQNLIVEQRYADAHPERLNALAAELKAANVDVIVTFGYPAALSAKVSADDVPVVVTGAGDPVATRLVDGMARPGGHLTGVTELSTDLSAKRLEILRTQCRTCSG